MPLTHTRLVLSKSYIPDIFWFTLYIMECLRVFITLRWTCNRQMKLEGGFQGRTNKLVDGCYSFWQGGVFPLLHNLITNEGKLNFISRTNGLLFKLQDHSKD